MRRSPSAPVAPARPSPRRSRRLRTAGCLSWVNRIVRIRERCADLFGHMGSRWRVIRTSNGYQFHDPKGAASKGFPSKSDFPSGTSIQDSTSSLARPCPARNRPLDRAGSRHFAVQSRPRKARRLRCLEKAERACGRNISLEEDSEPLRGLCSCALCAPQAGAGAPPRARARRTCCQTKERPRRSLTGTNWTTRETPCPSKQSPQPRDDPKNIRSASRKIFAKAEYHSARTRQKVGARHAPCHSLAPPAQDHGEVSAASE